MQEGLKDGYHFNVDYFRRSLSAAVVIFLAFFLSWALPAFLKWVFRRVLQAEIVYCGPASPFEDEVTHKRRRRRYARASYWRTVFFQLFYAILSISLLFTGVVIALWLLHWDLWFLVAGLGIYSAIVLFQVGPHLHNVFAFFCITMDAHAQIRKGDRVRIGSHEGVLVSIGMQRACLCIHKSDPSAPSGQTPDREPDEEQQSFPLQQQPRNQQTQQRRYQQQQQLAFLTSAMPVTDQNLGVNSQQRRPSATVPDASRRVFFGQHQNKDDSVHSVLEEDYEGGACFPDHRAFSQRAHPSYYYVFIPTAHLLMQTVVRLERLC